MANSGKKKIIFIYPKQKKKKCAKCAKCATTNGEIAFALYIKKNAMTAEIVGDWDYMSTIMVWFIYGMVFFNEIRLSIQLIR